MKSTVSLRSEKRRAVISVIVVLVLGLAAVFSFLSFYGYNIDRTLYAERLSQMREVTTQLFSGLEDVMNNQWRTASEQCRTLQYEQPKTMDEFLHFMEEQIYLGDLAEIRCNVVAVDNTGLYYTQNGKQGLLPERQYLTDMPERVSYVSNSMITDETRMVFLQRLEEPVVVQGSDKPIRLTYYGISQNMEELDPYFECSAYNGNNSVYVVDSDGLKLFSSSGSSLLKGFNVYSILGDMNYLHGSSFSEAKAELDSDNIAYSNAIIEDTEVYYALYRMDNAEWTLIFLVPSRYVATNTVDLVNMTIRLVLIFAVTLVIVSVSAIFILLKKQQKTAMDLERQNNANLERINGELANAVEVAEKATKAKSDFLSNMSHDIRTPMNAIVGITSLMAREKGLNDRMNTYISKIQMSSQHLLSLINDVLDMSKIESSEVTLNSEPVSFAEMIGQVDSIIRSQTNERGQSFRILVHSIAHEYVISDAVRLRQLLINLLSNATKYTPAGGTVTLDLAEIPCGEPGYASYTITVTDTGYGMTPEFLKHIFEPFTRAESSVTNKVQGTGLGMAIAKSIVELMGGTIKVNSVVNQGTRFEVELKMQIDHNADMTTDIGSALLITDDEVLRSNIEASMREVNVDFHVVSTKEEAAEILEQREMDIILVSGHLTDDGLPEKISLLRNSARDALLIFFVEYAQPELVEDLLKQSGVDGLIPRPFFLSNLLRTIERIRKSDTYVEEKGSVLNGLRFLCAEDNDLNAEILETMLGIEGASCTICHNGREIVETFRTVKPGDYDAILMDVQMPLMNGLDATREIRAGENPLGRTIPILAMTANAFSEDIQNSMNAGMDVHISKPIDIRVLKREMNSFATAIDPESGRRIFVRDKIY